jgi:hypothetical protein
VEGDPPHVIHQHQAAGHKELPEAEHLDAVLLWGGKEGGREGGRNE